MFLLPRDEWKQDMFNLEISHQELVFDECVQETPANRSLYRQELVCGRGLIILTPSFRRGSLGSSLRILALGSWKYADV